MSFLDLLERALAADHAREQEQRRLEGRDKKTNPYVTDAVGCDRKLALSLQNVEGAPFTTDSLLNFAFGHASEEAIASILAALEDAGLRLYREVRIEIPNGPSIVSGRIDLLLYSPNTQTLIELKSTTTKQVGFLQKTEGREEHRAQLLLYEHASQIGRLIVDGNVVPPIHSGILAYVIRDAPKGTRMLHEFPVAYNASEAHRLLSRLRRIEESAKEGHVPPIPAGYEWKRFPCSYCTYRDLCHSNLGGER